ncbi:MAG TPA: DUF1697 domain-containing protein [Acidobacteria bacterium]|nr:DUF1697 domain-containing protein [Acidobacteriota bacterium]
MATRQGRSRSGSGTHVALLRAINVGGRNRLPMARLVGMFDEVGCQRVRTYIQSGNVVFDASPALASRVASLVSSLIAVQMELKVPTVTRTAAELERIVSPNPFVDTDADTAIVHVGFLANAPTPTQIATLDPERSPPDECVVHGRELYLHCPNGVARTKFTTTYLDRVFDTTVTVRNWRTTLAVLDLART